MHTHTPPPKIAPAAPIGCGDLDVRRRVKFRRGRRGECGAALEPGGPTAGWVTPLAPYSPQEAPCLGPEPAAPSRPPAPPRRGPELGCGGLGASSAFCSPRPHSPSSLWRPRADTHRPAPRCPRAGGPLHPSTPSSLHQRLKAREVLGKKGSHPIGPAGVLPTGCSAPCSQSVLKTTQTQGALKVCRYLEIAWKSRSPGRHANQHFPEPSRKTINRMKKVKLLYTSHKTRLKILSSLLCTPKDSSKGKLTHNALLIKILHGEQLFCLYITKEWPITVEVRLCSCG